MLQALAWVHEQAPVDAGMFEGITSLSSALSFSAKR